MSTETIEVPVVVTWFSKINWAQAVGLAVSALTIFGIDMDEHTQLQIVALIQAVVAVATWVFRTFFTASVTPSSASLMK
jgi:hypothetical protein